MTTHQHFTGVFGQPKVVYTDHAPSLIKAANSYDWAETATVVSATGTEWRLTAKACSWRNGLAERVIRSARHTLAGEVIKGELLDFHEFSAVLSIASAILNSRTLSVCGTPDRDFIAIAPRDVILGRAARSSQDLDSKLESTMRMEDDVRLDETQDGQSMIIIEWRKKWLSQVFMEMVPLEAMTDPVSDF